MYRLGGNEPTYDTLSLAEFVAGYLSIMEEATTVCPLNSRLLNHIAYLRQLMEDSFLADWHVVRAAHAHVLNAIEHRRFAWENTEQVMETKRIALNRMQINHFNVAPAPVMSSHLQTPQGAPPVVCMAYQQLTCPMLGDHEIDGVLHLHCCNFCYVTNGNCHTHPQTQCRKAKEANKNQAKPKSHKRHRKE